MRLYFHFGCKWLFLLVTVFDLQGQDFIAPTTLADFNDAIQELDNNTQLQNQTLQVSDDTYGVVQGPFDYPLLVSIPDNADLVSLDDRLADGKINTDLWYRLEWKNGQEITVKGEFLISSQSTPKSYERSPVEMQQIKRPVAEQRLVKTVRSIPVNTVIPTIPERSVTQISGLIKSPISHQLELAFSRSTTIESRDEIVTNVDSELNTFATKIFIEEPQMVEIAHGDKTLLIYVEPGDDIEIEFIGYRPEKNIQFAGQGGANNNYLLGVRQKFGPLEEDLFTALYSTSPKQFKRNLNLLADERIQYLEQYPDREAFSEGFYRKAINSIEQWRQYHYLRYAMEWQLANETNEIPVEIKSEVIFSDGISNWKTSPLVSQESAHYVQQYFEQKKKGNLPFKVVVKNQVRKAMLLDTNGGE
ncbi:MAG: hypothetical protein AB8G22_16330 [Saprospiraceae bacterium]